MEPVSAPSSFALPSPTVAYLGDGKGGLFKHTATWKWGEGEWKVVVKKEMGTKRVEKELPVMKEDLTPHANRVGRAKLKMHDSAGVTVPHRTHAIPDRLSKFETGQQWSYLGE